MSQRRISSQSGLVTYPDGSKGVLVAGGDLESSSEFLNINTMQTWEPRASLPYIISHGASVPYQDSFLVVGGYNAEDLDLDTIYYCDPERDAWELFNQRLEDIRSNLVAILVPDDYVMCD